MRAPRVTNSGTHAPRPFLVVALAVGLLVAVPLPGDAMPGAKICKRCSQECKESLATCIATDPRLPECAPEKPGRCLRRAKRGCKRNIKTCCRDNCRRTGTIVCCGSAVSATTTTLPFGATTTLPPGVTTTTTSGGPTTTLPPGSVPCTSDAECGSCECCNAYTGTCTGPTGPGAAVCCNIPGQPQSPIGGTPCGPKTPAQCPTDAVCGPPGQPAVQQYLCHSCRDSGAIIEWYKAGTDTSPPTSCFRR